MTEPLSLRDLYSLKTITDLALSPDGQWVVYGVKAYREEKNDSYTNLWLARTAGTGKPHRLTRSSANDSSPAWSPDGRRLAFLSAREDEVAMAAEAGEENQGGSDEPKPQLWVFDMELGGEPRQLTNRAEGVNEFDWSPEGDHLVFAARDPSEEQEEYLKSVRGKDEDEGKGPLVIERTQHKHDQHGFLDDVPIHLFTVNVEDREVRQLTHGSCDEVQPRWSPTGSWVVFVSNRTGDADNNRRTDLWLVRPDGGEARRLTFGDLDCSAPSWSPDGSRVAFVASLEPENAYVLRHVMVVETANAQPIGQLSEYVGQGWSDVGGIVPDAFSGDPAENARNYPVPEHSTNYEILSEGLDRPAMSGPVWLSAERLVCLFADRGQTRLVEASVAGEAQFVFPTQDRLCSLSTAKYPVGMLDAKDGLIAMCLDSPEAGPNVVTVAAAELGCEEPAYTQVTSINDELHSGRQSSDYRRISFENGEGEQVEALVALPPGFDEATEPAPVIAKIHGGPMSYDAPTFRFETEYWTGLGYVVVMVNYRGSTSYGEDFCTVIRGDWGPREHQDVMAGLDAVIERGWGDPDRLFCTGFSQGGIMTNWAVGHTDRFRAAAAEHGMWDYIAAFGTDDCHLWWQDDVGVPWQNEEQYTRIAPASGLTDIATPLLIMAGELDWRCPLSQSEQAYVALKKRGIPTRLVVYQEERHAITKPRRAVDRIRRITEWFEQYGGAPFSDDSAKGYPGPAVC